MSTLKSLLNYFSHWFVQLISGDSLSAKRKRYFFVNVSTLPGLDVQQGDPIPVDEIPRAEWWLKVLKMSGKVNINHLYNVKDQKLRAVFESEITKLDSLNKENISDPKKIYERLTSVLTTLTAQKEQEHSDMSWPTSLAEYNSMFHPDGIPLPDIHRHFKPKANNEGWFEDSFFADLRTAGFNPMVIRGVNSVPSAFSDMSDAQYQIAAGAGFELDTLAAAAADERLYYCDYSILSELIVDSSTNAGGTDPGNKQKYIYTPKALFVLPPTASESQPASLLPVAIRLKDDGPLFYPNNPDDSFDGLAWTQAKYAVNSADGNHHELVSHLGWTHLVIEPFVVCTQRNLSEKHALYKLLVPHFEGTIFINNAAAEKLIAKDGQVHEILASVIPKSQQLAVKARAVNTSGLFKFNQQFVRKELTARNVMNKKLLFPYRDDALLVSDAIANWVSDYVDIYYKNDADVENDIELQNWAKELISTDQQGGQIQDFGDFVNPDNVISTKAYLKDALSLIIFTSSAQHAAVNFSQAKLMLYVPAFPGAMYRQVPDSIPSTVNTYSTDGENPGLLTPDSVAKVQLDLLALLGGVFYTKLGDYDSDYFDNEAVNKALLEFQTNLEGIGAQIAAENAKRPLEYPYLIPDQIPQSINI